MPKRVLIAEDELIPRKVLQAVLFSFGYEVIVAGNGNEALEILQSADAPPLAILDVEMPGIDGIEVCRKLRAAGGLAQTYIILLTGRVEKADIVAGLAAGANDYVTKPFEVEELNARIRVGLNVIELQLSLAARVNELEIALDKVKRLQGLLPICSHCKSIRNDQNYWQRVENFFTENSEAMFSHSICPTCYDVHVKPELELLRAQVAAKIPPGPAKPE